MPFTVQGVRGNCIIIFQPRDHKFSSIKKDLLDIRRDAYIEHRRASYIATCGEFGVAIFRMWRYLAWHHARIPTLGMLTSSWPESGTQHFLRERFDKTCRSVCSWWTTVSLSCFAIGYEYLLEFTGQNLGSSPLWPIYLPPCPLAWTLQTQNMWSMKQIQSHLGCTQIAQSLLPISWIVVGCAWIFQDFPPIHATHPVQSHS